MITPPEVPMRTSLSFLVAGCLAAMPGLVGVVAADPAFDTRYAVQTMGVDLGRASLRLDPASDNMHTKFRFEVDALLGFVEASDTRMESIAAASRSAITPRRFAAIYRKEDRLREIDLGYDAQGGVGSFQLAKRGQVRLDAVPGGLPPQVTAPLAAFLRARDWLGQAPEGAELALPVFDGRKLYEAQLRYLGLTQLSGEHGTAPAHRVAVRYVLTQALNEDTGVLEREKGARTRELELAVSADGRYVPLRLDGSLDGLPVSAVLSADCAAPGGCPD
jgi:hypothetical protein